MSWSWVRRRLLLSLAALPVVALAPAAQEGGIATFAGATLFESGTRVSISHIFKRRDKLFRGRSETFDASDRLFRESRTVVAVDHGLHRDWTVSLLVPYVDRELNGIGMDAHGSGPGDLTFLVKHRFYMKNWKRGGFNAAVIVGLEMPTGETDERQAGLRLAPSLQPGSGSWDPFTALALTSGRDRWRFDGLLLHKRNSEGAQDFEEGDFTAIGASVGYRFYFETYPGPTAKGTLGLQWRHTGRSESNGARVGNSGNDELRFQTGLTWHPIPQLDLSLSVAWPLHQNFHGEQLAQGLQTFIAAGIRF